MRKQEIDRQHFYRRLYERYGISLSDGDYQRILKGIRCYRDLQASGQRIPFNLRFVRRETNTRSLWMITVFNYDIPIIYSKESKALVTALPPSS